MNEEVEMKEIWSDDGYDECKNEGVVLWLLSSGGILSVWQIGNDEEEISSLSCVVALLSWRVKGSIDDGDDDERFWSLTGQVSRQVQRPFPGFLLYYSLL